MTEGDPLDEQRQKAENKLRAAKEISEGQTKFVRDPVHDLIELDHPLFVNLLDTEPMQRLRDIRCLGLASMVYPGAEHSRLAHSLGVYHLSGRLLLQLLGPLKSDKPLDYYDRMVVRTAALLHDVGHGPLSHLFELITKDLGINVGHEDWTSRIIEEHAAVKRILDSFGEVFRKDVRSIIKRTHKKNYLSQIVSSQFDADRLDYMLRDSMMTGVHYGRFDLNWILRSLRLVEAPVDSSEDSENADPRRLAVDGRRGLSSLEHYLQGNLNLYSHVYHHKTVVGAEVLLRKILRRVADLCQMEGNDPPYHSESPLYRLFCGKELSVDEYCTLTDSTILNPIRHWARKATDDVLEELCASYSERRLFRKVDISGEISQISDYRKKIDLVEKELKKADVEPGYFYEEVSTERTGYKSFTPEEIWFQDSGDRVKRYSVLAADPDDSPISAAIIAQAGYGKPRLWFTTNTKNWSRQYLNRMG